MELIPILSLIILVATISTFVLAVGAYILFKVRERRGQRAKAAAPPASIPAELIAPTPLMGDMGKSRTFEESAQITRPTGGGARPTFFTATKDNDPTRPQMKPTFTSLAPTKLTGSQFTRPEAPTRARATAAPTRVTSLKTSAKTSETEQYDKKKKFMRYTAEGYVDPSRDKGGESNKQEETLRWR
ncbi:MAG: hypothetical protein K9J12_14475 [Melioribacteraceae bacterium]|nr:hypothetical protein [Melioribacteraceae bacterium]MCF8265630.1 hypothetical protein [Melioribacteraceae bacterium]MCF8412165.1 hypothetical protein [Melioribacteraceae bacterium]